MQGLVVIEETTLEEYCNHGTAAEKRGDIASKHAQGAGYALVRMLPERRLRMLMHRRLANRGDEMGQRVCFDLVGCFTDRVQPLRRPPQHPSIIQTQFLLYTRENRESPTPLEYGDHMQSMNRSQLSASKKVRVIIHGYKGSGSGRESKAGVKAFLDLEDVNVIVVDWARGAGSSYGTAVSNTELVGRQLGLILLDTLNMGVRPENIHLIGFSLGAHVAGCASQLLKNHNILVGRITGLDPASPFFRHHLLREKTRKLDISDAQLVDVIHTDGSSDFADGFGLLKPIGHIDFFPNGGSQQPGCNDVKNSVVVSHLNEDSLDVDIACSHVRSWFLFIESLRSQLNSNGCKFQSWSCKYRVGSYATGSCFPPEESSAAPELGYAADTGPSGQYYLPTRAQSPFCGRPLRASVKIAEMDPRPRGLFSLAIGSAVSRTIFKIICDQASLPLSSLNNRNSIQPIFYGIEAADFNDFPVNASVIEAFIKFEAAPPDEISGVEVPQILLVDRISLEDRKGNRWNFCAGTLSVGSRDTMLSLERNVECI
ncbi:hypothetical protein QAD02_023818 [Eretmocerus hayati]|uniref:Uncharacterized protein n=1 Tax=Eretmocerus hayati TaxID=131215 RepID=A0ACC2PY17_9HYME|nr:hypothetical protein QAD02_023818 [Eretmocerus hayati]